MSRILACVGIVLLTAATLSGCARDQQPAPSTQQVLSGDYSGTGPGTLVSAVPDTQLEPDLISATSLAARVTFTSTAANSDTDQTNSGLVLVPVGDPPPGGWPIVAYAHPSTGIEWECAPSLTWSLLGSLEPVLALLKAGYVVTVPDYQGLGLDGTYHPFLDSQSAARNLIDSVHAARKLVPDTATGWVAYGTEQGGQAAWAANEVAASYSDTDLIGAVSVSPYAGIDELADAAADGTLTKRQLLTLQWFLAATKNAHPDFDVDAYRRGVAKTKWDVLSTCQDRDARERAGAANQLTADDLRPADHVAVDVLRGYLQKASLPQGPAKAPMLVVYGGADPVVPEPWTAGAVGRACAMGDTVAAQLSPDLQVRDADGVVDSQIGAALPWIADRFAGVPQPNDFCLAEPVPAPEVADEQTPEPETVDSLAAEPEPVPEAPVATPTEAPTETQVPTLVGDSAVPTGPLPGPVQPPSDPVTVPDAGAPPQSAVVPTEPAPGGLPG